MKRNPKQADSNLYDCIPQTGPCPIGCNQCFYNRPGAFYVPIDQPHFPTLEEVGDGIVRINCGNDSNNRREHVIASTAQYPRRFFNTSLPKFDFPGPVVLTANPREEEIGVDPYEIKPPANLMFVRLRVSSTNLELIREQIANWSDWIVPVVLTFMAYYDAEPQVPAEVLEAVDGPCYEWRVRHINSYWCPTAAFIRHVLDSYQGNRLVSYCGSLDGSYCRLCRNCETYYIQAIKRMKGE
ncbi:MAG: hypothetical protein KJZ78_18725, partial [Bryobacteraceae bacterium]|nr:hypothetical protein [Bryobacteraceae bacterium]